MTRSGFGYIWYFNWLGLAAGVSNYPCVMRAQEEAISLDDGSEDEVRAEDSG